MSRQISRGEIEDAFLRIEPHTRRTPVLDLGDALGHGWSLVLKLEHTQVTGSFKPRGAFSLLTKADIPDVGIAAASGGNFGIAAAFAAAQLGHKATVFVPETSPLEKIEKIGIHGADVRAIPGYYNEALSACDAFVEDSGAFSAHAYDHPDVMAGQGTVAMEISSQVPDATAIVVAVGGGGLIGGIASWARGDVRVVSGESEACNSLHASRQAGKPVSVKVGGVASSSLGAASVGEYPWAANEWIDAAVLVTDEEIIEAQNWLWKTARVAAEPAAATTVATLIAKAYRPKPGDRVVAVISGANVDPASIR